MMNSNSGFLSEFDIIQRYFSGVGGLKLSNTDTGETSQVSARSRIILAGGDDCAVISLAENQHLAISIDTLVEGVHFPVDASPADIARRALSVSVSDLAAMGADPLAFTLAITLPDFNSDWLEQFSFGLNDSAIGYQIPLIGGDTTKGPLTITIQVHGAIDDGKELRRSGAQIGDSVYVSGHVGDAAIALDIIQQRLLIDDASQFFYKRFYQPRARVNLGKKLLGVAHSAVDVSDGLLADTGHIAKASNVGIKLFADQLPFSPPVTQLINEKRVTLKAAQKYALTGGDDYELCFTVAPNLQQTLIERVKDMNLAVTKIGEVVSGSGVQCIDCNGEELVFSSTGFQHF